MSPDAIKVSPSYHSTTKFGAPEDGVNLQNSSVASQTPVFLPGGVNAIVPVGFWTPTTALPSFQVAQVGLLNIFTSIVFEDSYKIIWLL